MRVVLGLLWKVIVIPVAFVAALVASPFMLIHRRRRPLDPDWLFLEKEREQKAMLKVKVKPIIGGAKRARL